MRLKGFLRSKREKASAEFREEEYLNSESALSGNPPADNSAEDVKQKKFPDIREAFQKIADAVNNNYNERNLAEIERAKQEIKSVLSRIKVIAFVGGSGTGKSTRAIQIAKKHGISHIIDDGLLINGGRVIAGLSAKRAGSKLESVRQALFVDENRAEVMRRALAENLPDKLMILGTSEGMLNKIGENLWLSPPSAYIRIEDVTTEDERRKAVFIRSTQGRHTIPVPSMEIKHEFSGYFTDPLNRILRRRDRLHGTHMGPSDQDKTVVRPTFSTLGSYSISNEALSDIADIIIRRRVEGAGEILRFNAEMESYGVVIDLEISLVYGYNAQEVLREAQNKIASGIEDLTAMNVVTVNLKAKRVVRTSKGASPD